MRQALYRHRFDARIRQDNLLVTDRRRITLVCSRHVRLQNRPHAGQVTQKLLRHTRRRARQVIRIAIVAWPILQAPMNFVLQAPRHRRYQFAGVRDQLVGMDRILVVEPGKHQAQQIPRDLHHRFAGWEIRTVQMIDPAVFVERVHQLVENLGQFLHHDTV